MPFSRLTSREYHSARSVEHKRDILTLKRSSYTTVALFLLYRVCIFINVLERERERARSDKRVTRKVAAYDGRAVNIPATIARPRQH